MQSPFQFQLPLRPEDVRGRDGLLATLVEQVTNRRITALLGPRRFGKTSVLRRLAADLTEIPTVWLDLYGVQSLADIATRLDQALVRAPAAFQTEASQVAAKIQITLGVVRAEFARPRRSQPDPTARFGQLLEVFVDATARCPALLVIDEFSDIGRVRGAAEHMRTAFQHHASDFGLVLAGSHVAAMRQLFAGREQPFYGQAELLTIGPLDAATVHAIVTDGFAATGRDPGNVASLIHHVAGGHPQRTMLLADAAWTHPASGPVDEQWGSVLAEVRARLDGSMRTVHDTLTVSEQRVLRLLAHDEPLFGTASDQLGLTAGAAQSAIKQLVAHGHVTIDAPRTVTDPLFADWFRQTLPL